MQKAIRKFTADGNAVTFAIGFVPEKATLKVFDATNITTYDWYYQMEQEATPIYGFKTNGADGVVTAMTTAATGLSAYDSEIQAVMVDSPVPGRGKIETPWVEYAAASTPTARTGAIIGTIVKPSTRNGYVYECTTSTGAVVTEPTWPTTPGSSVTDDASNVWTCRPEDNVVGGAKGITVGATTQTDGYVCMLEAERVDSDSDAGDVGNYAAGQVVPKSQ